MQKLVNWVLMASNKVGFCRAEITQIYLPPVTPLNQNKRAALSDKYH
jgi:hypothetical protein